MAAYHSSLRSSGTLHGCAMYPSVCPIPVAKTSFLLRYRACTTYWLLLHVVHGCAMYPSDIYRQFSRVVHGGGGGIRTRVPKYQIKSLYMFILLFNLPAGTSADGISDRQPFKASSNTLKANESQTILLATSLQPRRLNRKTGCSI